jgi:hypothetical protein
MGEFRQATVIRYSDVVPLVEALKFYAKQRHWLTSTGECDPDFDKFTSPTLIEQDQGKRARDALMRQPQVRIATAEIET